MTDPDPQEDNRSAVRSGYTVIALLLLGLLVLIAALAAALES